MSEREEFNDTEADDGLADYWRWNNQLRLFSVLKKFDVKSVDFEEMQVELAVKESENFDEEGDFGILRESLLKSCLVTVRITPLAESNGSTGKRWLIGLT